MPIPDAPPLLLPHPRRLDAIVNISTIPHKRMRTLSMAGTLMLTACGGGGSDDASVTPGGTGEPSPAATVALPIPPGQIDAAVARLDGLSAEVMQRFQIPGMAVAVVKDGRTVYAKGFGVRRVGGAEPVDADTVFQLASMSKPIAATVVAGLVGQKRLSWDTPAKDLLPWFSLSNDGVTQQVTVGDLFSHRSGLGNGVGDQLEDLGYDRRQVLERLRYAPLDRFRITYHYANFGLTAGAEAAAASSGLEWATLSERTLYQPLGMTVTSSRFADFVQRPNRATPHVKRDGRYQALFQRRPDAQSPAGGVSSSANDVARWMSMVLQDGKYAGGTLIPPSALLPAVSPQSVSAPASTPSERTGFYGYGFNVGTTSAGRVKLSHSGAFILGTGTAFTAIPQAGIAIVTLTNAAPTGAAETVNAMFEEMVETGGVSRDWHGFFDNIFANFYVPEGSLVGKTAPPSPVSPLGGNAYVGTYASDYYGDAVVEAAGNGLQLRMGAGGRVVYPLRHWNGNTFVFDLEGENAPPGSISRIDFQVGATGSADRMQMEYYAQDLARGAFNRKTR
jgi:CubicO group peptidase (beta-lactamase class C family)